MCAGSHVWVTGVRLFVFRACPRVCTYRMLISRVGGVPGVEGIVGRNAHRGRLYSIYVRIVNIINNCYIGVKHDVV